MIYSFLNLLTLILTHISYAYNLKLYISTNYTLDLSEQIIYKIIFL